MAVKKKKIKNGDGSVVKMTRKNRITISLNDKEMAVLNRFYNKYKISNHTKWLRETIIIAILKKFDEDAPKLFDEAEMR